MPQPISLSYRVKGAGDQERETPGSDDEKASLSTTLFGSPPKGPTTLATAICSPA